VVTFYNYTQEFVGDRPRRPHSYELWQRSRRFAMGSADVSQGTASREYVTTAGGPYFFHCYGQGLSPPLGTATYSALKRKIFLFVSKLVIDRVTFVPHRTVKCLKRGKRRLTIGTVVPQGLGKFAFTPSRRLSLTVDEIDSLAAS
jgi:hypothetical protein